MEKKTFSPIVLTSKKAKQHFEKIKATHNELMASMAAQAEKVKMYREQKKQEQMIAQQQQTEQGNVKAQQDAANRKEQMTQEANMRKEAMAHEKEMAAHKNKSEELAIKRMALTEKE